MMSAPTFRKASITLYIIATPMPIIKCEEAHQAIRFCRLRCGLIWQGVGTHVFPDRIPPVDGDIQDSLSVITGQRNLQVPDSTLLGRYSGKGSSDQNPGDMAVHVGQQRTPFM